MRKIVLGIASSQAYTSIKISTLSKVILKIHKYWSWRNTDEIVADIQAIKSMEICYSMLLIQSNVDLQLGNSCLDRTLSQM